MTPSIELPFCQPLNDLSSLVILLGVDQGHQCITSGLQGEKVTRGYWPVCSSR
uniref:Uncharacterized protein n=1 Tax=Anguilla anguilla TaxID=7936 RepID=A0A0E9Y202_ANGAN